MTKEAPGAMQQPGSPTYLVLNIPPQQLLTVNFPTELRRFFSSSSDKETETQRKKQQDQGHKAGECLNSNPGAQLLENLSQPLPDSG